ncbi:MAG: glycerophosphodiester phosphodiesterase [bacterium]|nr:glycerophosphodiester phosphodiesterase [bacterium]
MKELKTIFIAHRGESYDAPENTLAAINLAWQRNADAVEIDVFLSKDMKIVAIHDSNTLRLAGIDKNVEDQTLAELKKLNIGKHKGDQWANERIPTLEEVFATVPKNKLLVIEIKCGSEILPILKQEIHQSGLEWQQIKLIGFDLDLMKAARAIFPALQIFWIKSIDHFKHLSSWQLELGKLIDTTRQANLDGLCFSSGKFIDKNFVDKIKEAKLACHIWTVDHVADARQFIDAGVDGIISNRPHWLKSQLGII